MIGVLFVCVGNICRSPLAEVVFGKLAEDAGLGGQFKLDSAGIGNWHEGEPADYRTRNVAKANNLNVTHRARQIRPKDLFEFHYVLTMEEMVHQHVEKMRQSRAKSISEVLRMRAFDPQADGDEVPDPYTDNEAAFVEMYDILLRSSEALLERIKANHNL